MTQIVKTQIIDTEYVAGTRERRPYALWIIGKYVVAGPWLTFCNIPCFRRVFEAFMVTFLCSGMLRIADKASMRNGVIVLPFETTDFGFASCRACREPHDVPHGNARPPIPSLKIFIKFEKFLRGRPAVATLTLCEQAQFSASSTRLFDNFWSYRKRLYAFRGAQDDGNPGQIIANRG